MFQCPQCPQTFPTIFMRDQHLQTFHRGSGWYEGQQTVIGEKGLPELKALEHSLALQRDKIEKQRPLSNPIPAPIQPIPKEELIPSKGWKKLSDGSYVFEEEIYKHNTPFDSIIVILEGKLNPKHGTCIEHKYTKDLAELEQLKQKAICLDSKLSSKVPLDPSFHEIAREFHENHEQIKKIERDMRPDEVHTLIMEDYYRFEPGDEQIKWMKQFMDKVISESERLAENHKKSNS